MARRRRRRRLRKNPSTKTLLLLGGGAAAAYYFLVMKPQQDAMAAAYAGGAAQPPPKSPWDFFSSVLEKGWSYRQEKKAADAAKTAVPTRTASLPIFGAPKPTSGYVAIGSTGVGSLASTGGNGSLSNQGHTLSNRGYGSLSR